VACETRRSESSESSGCRLSGWKTRKDGGDYFYRSVLTPNLKRWRGSGYVVSGSIEPRVASTGSKGSSSDLK
jgi:hypothetical protein